MLAWVSFLSASGLPALISFFTAQEDEARQKPGVCKRKLEASLPKSPSLHRT